MKTNPQAPKVCPCGCGSTLARKRLVCARFWAGLPAVLRSRITSPASTVQDRRAAIREALALANKQRQATEQPVFNLEAAPPPCVMLPVMGMNYATEKAEQWVVLHGADAWTPQTIPGPSVMVWIPKGLAVAMHSPTGWLVPAIMLPVWWYERNKHAFLDSPARYDVAVLCTAAPRS